MLCQVASRMPAGSNPYATANQDAAAIAQSAYVAQLAAPVLAPHPDIMSWDMPVTNSMAGSVPSALALAVPNLAPVSSVQPEAEDRAFAPGAALKASLHALFGFFSSLFLLGLRILLGCSLDVCFLSLHNSALGMPLL